jgi:hypothetical protein
MVRFIICLSIVLPLFAFGQQACVANMKQNILYTAIDNPLMVTVENIACDSILVSTSNGRITGSNCNYSIRVFPADTLNNRILPANIKVSGIVNGDTVSVGTFAFRVQDIPLPVAMVANRAGGEVSAAEMKVQTGVAATVENFDLDYAPKVKSYSLLIHNSIRTTHFYNVEGPYFTQEIKDYFFYLRNGDKVFVFDVQVQLPNGKTVTLKPVQFDIK